MGFNWGTVPRASHARMSLLVKPQRPRRAHAGFTMVELIVVMILAGILAAFAIPKIGAALNVRDDAWRDALVSALRIGQKTAVSHRRLVCVQVTATTVAVRIASSNPATACDQNLLGPNGQATFAAAGNSAAGTTAANLFFQPDGRVSTDGAGGTVADFSISAAGVNPIRVLGQTGYVD